MACWPGRRRARDGGRLHCDPYRPSPRRPASLTLGAPRHAEGRRELRVKPGIFAVLWADEQPIAVAVDVCMSVRAPPSFVAAVRVVRCVSKPFGCHAAARSARAEGISSCVSGLKYRCDLRFPPKAHPFLPWARRPPAARTERASRCVDSWTPAHCVDAMPWGAPWEGAAPLRRPRAL
jgi:hypothetical protein